MDLLTYDAAALLAVSFGVGIVVGLTGMGGGALMTPALIFLGIPPTTAVANDLVAAAANKSVGAAVHWKHGSPNVRLALLLIAGSVPFAFAGAFIIDRIGAEESQQTFVRMAIGLALLLTSATFISRVYFELRGSRPPGSEPNPRLRPLATLAVGMLGGLLVGITSVGAGSLIMVSLLLLYPTLTAVRLVGTDLLQAIPLVLAAAFSHVIVTGVTWSILLPLLIGGMPGTYLGAQLASWVPPGVIRRGIAIVLTLTGLAMVGVPPVLVGILGAAMVILGPLLWGAVRRAHGRPAFYGAVFGRHEWPVRSAPELQPRALADSEDPVAPEP
ncbi:sulfite exporter TauE/SafE family protein [Ornithinimicrobium cavernae]|uniref:sulfite exporter TauE/SafE family protein n=1 Tax=Ornithinimicrobium cavernae TaxID=2666047 RepID=UPI00192A4DB5|nr:sulfite exporter TauE/SafE family protein [Ornithinimicrobium cavernae]